MPPPLKNLFGQFIARHHHQKSKLYNHPQVLPSKISSIATAIARHHHITPPVPSSFSSYCRCTQQYHNWSLATAVAQHRLLRARFLSLIFTHYMVGSSFYLWFPILPIFLCIVVLMRWSGYFTSVFMEVLGTFVNPKLQRFAWGSVSWGWRTYFSVCK